MDGNQKKERHRTSVIHNCCFGPERHVYVNLYVYRRTHDTRGLKLKKIEPSFKVSTRNKHNTKDGR